MRNDIQDLKLNLTLDHIARMSKNQLKAILRVAVKKEAFKYLSDIQAGHSKTKNLRYSSLQLQPYLSSQRSTTIQQKAMLFKLRTRMIDVRDNFKSGSANLLCRCCQKSVETQAHLLQCEALCDQDLVTSLPNYNDLFEEDPGKIEQIGKILIEKFKKFKSFNPSAHNAIAPEDKSEDSDDNVRAADGEDSDNLVNCLSVRIGI